MTNCLKNPLASWLKFVCWMTFCARLLPGQLAAGLPAADGSGTATNFSVRSECLQLAGKRCFPLGVFAAADESSFWEEAGWPQVELLPGTAGVIQVGLEPRVSLRWRRAAEMEPDLSAGPEQPLALVLEPEELGELPEGVDILVLRLKLDDKGDRKLAFAACLAAGRLSRQADRPFWVVISGPGDPRAAVYAALAAGISGLFFEGPAGDYDRRLAVRGLREELRDMLPALSPPWPEQTLEKEGAADDELVAAVRTLPDQGALLFLAHALAVPVAVRIEVSGVHDRIHIRQLEREGNYPVSDGIFAEYLEPRGGRVFLIRDFFPPGGRALKIRIEAYPLEP